MSVKCTLYAFTINCNMFQNLSNLVRKINSQMVNRLPVIECVHAHLSSFILRHICEILEYILTGPESDGICKLL
jgi:hypothetical protein